MYNRWIEDGLQDLLAKEGIGTIVFQPLQRGALTDAFLKGIPPESAASLKEIGITEERIQKSRLLNEIAMARGQSLAQMAIAWILRGGKVTSVLVGAKMVKHVEDNVAALNKLEFSADELARIDAILKA
jgi:L-glyceraldehyde 3-phosphate reductase